jgi:hypothetical protein
MRFHTRTDKADIALFGPFAEASTRSKTMLIVGEQDFSLTREIVGDTCGDTSQSYVWSTTYHEEWVAKQDNDTVENLKRTDSWARKYVRILFGIDATELQPYPQFQFYFDTIFFTYPHVGNCDTKNALLLRGFFESASTLLRPVGQVYIVLLKGQCERWEAHELAFCAGLQIRGIDGQSFNWNNIRNGECQQYTQGIALGKNGFLLVSP